MGQYLYAGVCYSITAYRDEIASPKDIEPVMSDLFDLSIYHKSETETEYRYTLDSETLHTDIVPLLQVQQRLTQESYIREDLDKVIDRIRTLTAEEMIHLAKQKKYQSFQSIPIYEKYQIPTSFHRANIKIDSIIYVIEGKIEMEGYRSFLHYFTNLIRYPVEHLNIAGAIRTFIQ